MSTPAKTKVFLSYARKDDDPNYGKPDAPPNYDSRDTSLMRKLYEDLSAAEFDVWWDRVSLPARGEDFSEEIAKAIRAVTRFVLVAGPGAAESVNVRKEWEFALTQCLPITPMLRAGEYSLVPKAVSNVNAIDFRPPRDYSAALNNLIARLREDIIPLGQPINVPPLPQSFIQRGVPFNAAKDAIRADAIKPVVVNAPPRATAVYGYGGIGKSTLAAALACDCDVRRRFKDGVLWLDIGQNPIIASRQADLGALLGDAREHYQDEKSGKLRLSWLLGDKQLLLVLDDVWDHHHVEKFPVGSACRILLTTRSKQIAGLIDGADVPLNLLLPEEGAALIAAVAGGDANDALYLQISKLLGGHTLAITLAAKRLVEKGASFARELYERLQKPPRLFKDLKIHDNDKNNNLELSLSESYTALGEDGKRRFRLLGVVAPDGLINRALAQAIWADADVLDAEDGIDLLHRAGLLTQENGGEYRLHNLLRAYGRALAEAAGELADAFTPYAEYITAQARQFDEQQPQTWGDFEPFLASHLLEVGDRLVEQHQSTPDDTAVTDRALNFAQNIHSYLRNRREVHRVAWLEMGLRVAQTKTDQEWEALFLDELGMIWNAMGEPRKALNYHELALPLRRRMEDRGGEATTLNNIGLVWRAMGERRKALDYYEHALPLFRAVGDRGGEATTLNNIGLVWHALDKPYKALDYYEQALPLFRAVGDRGGEATTLNSIGMVWNALGICAGR